jgi:metal-sulfur cluster biosynthetic enzyme
MTENEIKDQIWQEIARVEDPEIGISIKELGLIYSVEVQDKKAIVNMTLTSMGCPAGPELKAGVHAACTRVPGIEEAEVEVVWVPKWDPRQMASEEAKMILGIFE